MDLTVPRGELFFTSSTPLSALMQALNPTRLISLFSQTRVWEIFLLYTAVRSFDLPTATLSASSQAGQPNPWRWLTATYPDQNPKHDPETSSLIALAVGDWMHHFPCLAQFLCTQVEVPCWLEIFKVLAVHFQLKGVTIENKGHRWSQQRWLIPRIAGSSDIHPIIES